LQSFDIIIVGAGTACCLAGMTAAEHDSKVLMLDCKDFKDIGKKICGDAIAAHHFKNVHLKNPLSNAIRSKTNAIVVCSPISSCQKIVKKGSSVVLLKYEDNVMNFNMSR